MRFFLSSCFIYIPVLNANSVDTDQTPRTAASDPGRHCFPMYHLWDARLKWVNFKLQRNSYFPVELTFCLFYGITHKRDITKQCIPDQTLQNAVSDQDLHCLC